MHRRGQEAEDGIIGYLLHESPPVSGLVPLNCVGAPIHEYDGAKPDVDIFDVEEMSKSAQGGCFSGLKVEVKLIVERNKGTARDLEKCLENGQLGSSPTNQGSDKICGRCWQVKYEHVEMYVK